MTDTNEAEVQPGWIILRTAPASTLRLAETLNAAGFEAWTPMERRDRRATRRRALVEQRVAILPRYVFVRAVHRSDMLRLARSPDLSFRVWDSDARRMITKGHPHFSVFRAEGAARELSDGSLASLRRLEADLESAAEGRARARAAREHQKGPPPKFTAGQSVHVDGAYDGLALTVAEDSAGKLVKLTHPDWLWPLEISAWKLKAIQAIWASPDTGDAALAA